MIRSGFIPGSDIIDHSWEAQGPVRGAEKAVLVGSMQTCALSAISL